MTAIGQLPADSAQEKAPSSGEQEQQPLESQEAMKDIEEVDDLELQPPTEKQSPQNNGDAIERQRAAELIAEVDELTAPAEQQAEVDTSTKQLL